MKTSKFKLVLLVLLSAFMIGLFIYAAEIDAIDYPTIFLPLILFGSIFLFFLNELTTNVDGKLSWNRVKDFLNS